MKYTTLKNDIVNILHSSDYNLSLKFYDKNGNTTINIDDAEWVYIHNENMIIEFMNDNDHYIYIWKNKANISDDFKSIIQRIRELAVLNGVSVQIRVYDNLDQRKIYNLIKTSIVSNQTQKEKDEMNESIINTNNLVESFKSLLNIAKNTKKPSDLYLSEEFHSQIRESLLKEMIAEMSNLKSLKNTNLQESLNKLLSITNLDEIKSLVESLNDKQKTALNESLESIDGIGTFVQQKYLNNVEFHKNKLPTEFILENVKVYKAKTKNDRENLINAYNKLITVAENAKSGLDLLKEIKHHKILETYNVSKKDLLNLWLLKDHKPINEQYAYVVEKANGDKIAFSDKLTQGIKSIAKFINEGGDKDSQICKNIVMETIKYNQIASFIIEYKDDYSVRKYIPQFKKMFKETVEKLNSNNFNKQLFESVEEELNYSKEMELLENKIGISHPALKYLAIEEIYKNYANYKMITESIDNDMSIMVNELKHYSTISSIVANYIIENKLEVKLPLNESVNKSNVKAVATKIYESLLNYTDAIHNAIASSLFNIIHTNDKFINDKIKYVNTLTKYCE